MEPAGRDHPGGEHGEARLHDLRRLQGQAEDVEPPPGAVDFGAGDEGQRHEYQRHGEDDGAETAHVTGAQQRDGEDGGQGRPQIGQLAAHEMKGFEADTLGHRR